MPIDSWRSSLALLRTRRFGTFWFATLLSNIGTWSQQVAEPWVLMTLGASPFLVGLDSFAQGAPAFLLTLLGGAIADQRDRRRVIVGFQSVQMLCPLLIVVLLLTHSLRPWIVIACSLVVGMTDALSMPSFQSIVPSIVKPEQIGTGIALNSTQFNLSRVIGPSIAGVLLASVGAAGAFGANAISYVPFILVALWILPPTPGHHGRIDAASLRAAVRAAFKAPGVAPAIATPFLTGLLCAPLFTFTPVLVHDVFRSTPRALGACAASFGIGGILGALVLLGIHPSRDRRPLSSRAAAAYGVLVVGAALAGSAFALAPVLLLAGLVMAMSNASANTFLQSQAEPALRGETVSLYMLATRGGMALGGLATGFATHFFGIQAVLAVNGMLAVLAHFIVGRWWMRSPPPWATELAQG